MQINASGLFQFYTLAYMKKHISLPFLFLKYCKHLLDSDRLNVSGKYSICDLPTFTICCKNMDYTNRMVNRVHIINTGL